MRSLAAILVALASLAGPQACAQIEPELKPERDLETWLGVALETRPFVQPSRKADRPFNKNFRTSFELGYRSNENLGSGKSVYSTLGFRYRLAKFLRVGMDHRYIMRDTQSNNTYRIDLQATSSVPIGRFDLDYRITGQHEFIPVYRFRDILRNRIALEFRTPKFPVNPYVSTEVFTVFHYTGNQLAGMRYDLGFKIDLGKDHGIDLIMRHDREIGVEAPLYRTIISIGYEYYWKR